MSLRLGGGFEGAREHGDERLRQNEEEEQVAHEEGDEDACRIRVDIQAQSEAHSEAQSECNQS